MTAQPLAAFVAFTVLAVATGCGESKTELPKDLNKPLPPPPVGAGPTKIKGKADAGGPNKVEQ